MPKQPLILTLVLVAALGCAADPATEQASRPPNVVFILADDLGYGDLGLYGSQIIETPHIDALGVAGVRFEAGYVAAAVCSPSRAGLMTGRYPQRHGYEFNPSGRDYGLRLDETTLAEVMRSAGYATGAVGKWQLGWEGGKHPLDRGFDEFFGVQSAADHGHHHGACGRSRSIRSTSTQRTYSALSPPPVKINMPAFPSPRSPAHWSSRVSPLWSVTPACRPSPHPCCTGSTTDAIRPNGIV